MKNSKSKPRKLLLETEEDRVFIESAMINEKKKQARDNSTRSE